MTRINFTNPAINNTFVVRNGTGMCRGIEVLDLTYKNPPKVMIAPINSKGKVANCNIDIPVEDIKEVAMALLRIAGCTGLVTTMKAGKSLINPELCHYSLNMSGRSAFVATTIDIDPDMEDPDSVVSDAVKQGVIDRDDAMEIVCVDRIDKAEYNHAMGIKTNKFDVGDEVDVTAKDGDMWSGVIYRATITKIVGDTITIEYSNDDEGDVSWDVDSDQCKICE